MGGGNGGEKAASREMLKEGFTGSGSEQRASRDGKNPKKKLGVQMTLRFLIPRRVVLALTQVRKRGG